MATHPMTTMRAVLLLPFLAACFNHPQFVANKVIEAEVPAVAVQQLVCESHNGDIEATGAPAETIVLRVEMSVRGMTQEEADANLQLLELGREKVGDRLRLFGKYPANALDNRSPSFAFTLIVPARLALHLESHNGDIVARSVGGTVVATTHNGRIQAELAGAKVALKTHNGDVQLRLEGTAPLDGTVESHNGEVGILFGSGRAAAIAANPHNGRITTGGQVRVLEKGEDSLRGQVGEGGGKLTVTTHNGDITLQ